MVCYDSVLMLLVSVFAMKWCVNWNLSPF